MILEKNIFFLNRRLSCLMSPPFFSQLAKHCCLENGFSSINGTLFSVGSAMALALLLFGLSKQEDYERDADERIFQRTQGRTVTSNITQSFSLQSLGPLVLCPGKGVRLIDWFFSRKLAAADKTPSKPKHVFIGAN